jgi:hypothetical protein
LNVKTKEKLIGMKVTSFQHIDRKEKKAALKSEDLKRRRKDVMKCKETIEPE